MKSNIKEKLKSLALESEGIRGKFRLSAGVVYKGKLVATGIAQYKSHPILLAGKYRDGQIFMHAETQAIVRAIKLLSEFQLNKSEVYVVRVNKRGETALAKPCKGCFNLIKESGIKNVVWTTNEQQRPFEGVSFL